jgi:hypothetical protein
MFSLKKTIPLKQTAPLFHAENINHNRRREWLYYYLLIYFNNIKKLSAFSKRSRETSFTCSV